MSTPVSMSSESGVHLKLIHMTDHTDVLLTETTQCVGQANRCVDCQDVFSDK